MDQNDNSGYIWVLRSVFFIFLNFSDFLQGNTLLIPPGKGNATLKTQKNPSFKAADSAPSIQ